MQNGACSAVALGILLLLGGCVGSTSPRTSAANMSLTPTTAPAPGATPTTTATPAPVTSLPSLSDCLTDAVPRPGSVDGVEPSDYPDPPADVTRGSLVNWTQAFETAYFRNVLLADEVGEDDGDDDHNLTEASAYAEVRSVNQTANGYVIRLSDSGARTYASGFLSERWMDVGYVINETHVVRVPLTDRENPVRASAGTVVINCR